MIEKRKAGEHAKLVVAQDPRNMASRRRKTLVTCRSCHEVIHRDRSGWR